MSTHHLGYISFQSGRYLRRLARSTLTSYLGSVCLGGVSQLETLPGINTTTSFTTIFEPLEHYSVARKSNTYNPAFSTIQFSHNFPLNRTTMGFKFGSFTSIRQTAALVICPLVSTEQGIEPQCYCRNVDVAGKLLFQPCMLFSSYHLRILPNFTFQQRQVSWPLS
jgi:hypothetical protein